MFYFFKVIFLRVLVAVIFSCNYLLIAYLLPMYVLYVMYYVLHVFYLLCIAYIYCKLFCESMDV